MESNINNTNQPYMDEEISKRLSDLNEKMKDTDEIVSNEDILANVKLMLNLKKDSKMRKLKIKDESKYRQIFMRKFISFNMSFPSIYNKVMDDKSFELHRLEEMLKLRKNVQTNKISNFNASVQISQKYTDEFIKKPLNIK